MANMFQNHLMLLMEVFTLLRNAGLTVKLEKCMLIRKEIKYLDVEITQHTIKTDAQKTEAITL